METEVVTAKVIVLKLSEQEANLLRSMIQNAFCDPAEEPKDEAELRGKLWDGLTKALRAKKD